MSYCFSTLIWSLSLESTSKRIKTGSVRPGNIRKSGIYNHKWLRSSSKRIINCLLNLFIVSPALANSTSSLGSVAENSRVCLVSGSLRMTSWSCSAKPISNNLRRESAHSDTQQHTYDWILTTKYNYDTVKPLTCQPHQTPRTPHFVTWGSSLWWRASDDQEYRWFCTGKAEMLGLYNSTGGKSQYHQWCTKALTCRGSHEELQTDRPYWKRARMLKIILELTVPQVQQKSCGNSPSIKQQLTCLHQGSKQS